MRNLLIFFLFVIFVGCSPNYSKIDDKGLQIDIYNTDMTYEKFKQIVIQYADEASYPNLID